NIATYTSKFVTLAEAKGISILDTRKTMPGLRFLDKYSVRVGGGKNHRFGQTDVWMIKDNHKSYFGGLQGAISFFKKMGSFYNPLVVEVHSLDEFEKANSMGVKHFMLDNFNPGEIKEALKSKKEGTTIEVSGGIHLGILENYLIEGVDAISIGALTHSPETVDISLKMKRL
ncbi:MAG: nicotinate-nucleotide diphosphorylase (carboxylating), partial [Bdellovibrionota bacterium]|nr:nicotinate-nucleotide diphosphorylase (carboxylating) [Bdellovibrionota bacterium]